MTPEEQLRDWRLDGFTTDEEIKAARGELYALTQCFTSGGACQLAILPMRDPTTHKTIPVLCAVSETHVAPIARLLSRWENLALETVTSEELPSHLN